MEEEPPEQELEAAEIAAGPTKGRRGLVKIVALVVAVAVVLAVAYVVLRSGPAPTAGPTAFFIARQDRMTTSFDASGSVGGVGHPAIQSYVWGFGDGTTGTGVSTTHTYQSANRYTVTLTVSDGASTATAKRYVSPANTTVDVLYDRFFTADCPYSDFWPLRYNTYGDVIVQQQVPCLDFYPWVLYARHPDTNPSWIYTLYHFDAIVRNHPGYSVTQPVMLPVFNYSIAPAPSSYIFLNASFDYMGPRALSYWSTTPYRVSTSYSDGYGYLFRGNATMDFQESKRIFGVPSSDTPAQAQAWWYANTIPGNRTGALESAYRSWLYNLGNGKYDVYNGFQYYYSADVTDLNGTVDPSTGQTRVALFLTGWAFDVLLARWFYWGNASYQSAVCQKWINTTFAKCDATLPYGAVRPEGWNPMETCWCENETMKATIRSTMNLDYQGVSEYQFDAWADPGPDGIPKTSDDVAAWVFQPTLMDYVPPVGAATLAASQYPNSELRWYEGRTSVHLSPGSYSYGLPYEYMTVPDRWNLTAGHTLTLVLPHGPIPWIDPVRSAWDPTAKIGRYVMFNATLTLGSVKPTGTYALWDSAGNVVSIAGPWDWGTSTLPLESAPSIELVPAPTG
jgi:PKD repeat protein